MDIEEITLFVSRPTYRPLLTAGIDGVIDCGGTVGRAKGCRVVSNCSIESEVRNVKE